MPDAVFRICPKKVSKAHRAVFTFLAAFEILWTVKFLRLPALLAFAAWFLAIPARAVQETDSHGVVSFNTNDPDNTDIAGWESGWGNTTATGWDYVGTVGAGSGVYLGDGWVLTVAHVGAGNITLDSGTYDVDPNSIHYIYNDGTDTSVYSGLAGQQADLVLYQVYNPNPGGALPNLPNLNLTLTQPTGPAAVAMLGYGGSNGPGLESWGYNTVTATNVITPLDSYETIDFTTQNGHFFPGGFNKAQVVSGDSGGGDFILNGNSWELVGLNEAYGTLTPGGPTNSFMIQLDDYDAQIESITGLNVNATPEPPLWLLLPFGLGAVALMRRWQQSHAV